MTALFYAAVVAAYLSGSIPFGLILARARGIDLRQVGSGNIGATNAARALGRRLGLLVLLLDAAKGYLPLVVARRSFAGEPGLDGLLAAMGLAAFLGHVFPVWLRFRGGKGVATGLGIFVALAPISAAASVLAWALTYAITRISSVGSLVAATTLVVMLVARGAPRPTCLLVAAIYLLVLFTHRGNIRRLLHREERKV